MAGVYERPFPYKGRQYVAQYDLNLGEANVAMSRPPCRLLSETMSILQYRLANSESGSKSAKVLAAMNWLEPEGRTISILLGPRVPPSFGRGGSVQ